MIDVRDVYAVVCSYASSKGCTARELLPRCQQGLDWVYANLKQGADENSPLIAPTAAAMAEFLLYLSRITQTDTYESYKVGDMTIARDAEKELRLAERKRDIALAAAGSILKDGGFYCRGK